MIQPHTQSCSSFLQPVIIKLWEASHMSVCENSLRKLNGAHFIHNWMQIKIPLMRELKSWKGRLHAVNLRICCSFLQFVSILCHPSKVNTSVSSPFLESKRERFNNCWWRAFESFTICGLELFSPKSEMQGCQQLHRAWNRDNQPETWCLTRQAALPHPQWLKKSSGSALEFSCEEEDTTGKYFPCAWCGAGLWGEYTQPPLCPEEQNVLLRSHEWAWKRFPWVFLSQSVDHKKTFCAFLSQPCRCRLADSSLVPPYTETPVENEKMQQLSLS